MATMQYKTNEHLLNIIGRHIKVKIYRGTKEVGGTCVKLTADNGKILWVDLGALLEDKNPNIDYANNLYYGN